jgi:hypothetical protein
MSQSKRHNRLRSIVCSVSFVAARLALTSTSRLERAGSTMVESQGSHAVYVSQPQAVIKLIEQAAKATD